MAIESKLIPNLIQGVSQQAPQQRRDTQCEEQFDCINSPVDGAVARPGADLIKFLTGEDFEGAYCFDIYRGDLEHYLVVITPADPEDEESSPAIRVFDLMDGTECTVTTPDGTDYLETLEAPKDVFRACTVDDFTFIANREVKPAMDDASKSDPEPSEGMFYFRAGAYSVTYRLRITFDGTTTVYSYLTPNNSASDNAQYIATNQLATALYNALTGSAFAGFSKEINGNVVRIWRDDGEPFNLDSDDGQGDTHLKVIKGSVQAFSDLPQKAFDGFKVKVKGEDKNEEDDYYVTFRGNGTADSFWEEDVGFEVPTKLDAATMPWQLVNTDYRTFVFEKAPWGDRVAGDEDSAKDPSFVGKAIQDIFWDNPRLGIVTEGSCVWSKARNPYVYFPDTVQTVLATAPVDIQLSADKSVALLRRGVIAQDAKMLWAQKAQFRIHSNQEPFKQDTVEAPKSTSYEFAEKSDPCSVAASFYFAAEPGNYATIRDITFIDGKPRGDTDITQHVPKYVKAGVRQMEASDTLNMMVVRSEGLPTGLYIYNWFLTDKERVQSAWNTWRLPEESTILWIGIASNYLKMLVQRPDGVALLSANLAPQQTDPEGQYLTRLDFKVPEVELTTPVYDSETDTTVITMPYGMLEAEEDPSKVMVVSRQTEGDISRGTSFEVLEVDGNEVTVRGDASTAKLYIGFRISSERLESDFYLRTDQGSLPVDRLQVNQVRVVHAKTGYYRAVVTHQNGNTKMAEFEGRVLGDPKNVLDEVVLADGFLNVPVAAENGKYTLRLINDSFLPSNWQTAEYQYTAAVRTRPSRAKST